VRTQVAIVGAGLAGLHAALLLERAGIACRVFEARQRMGGRILSVDDGRPQEGVGDARGRYDLGPAWIWPDTQPLIRQLVAQLGLRMFPQQTDGAYLAERAAARSVLRHEYGFTSEPPAMRLMGGMHSLVAAIASRLPPAAVLLSHRVTAMARDASGDVLIHATSNGGPVQWTADSVILAMPPRLLADTIRFEPALPAPLLARMASIPTWMAAHAKVMAIYDTPFWREQGLSGSASSDIGPLVEIHDASPDDGLPALFGFVGLPAQARLTLGPDALQRKAVAQLARLFGSAASRPRAVRAMDWSADADTATAADSVAPSGHPAYGPIHSPGAAWEGRLEFGGTEVAFHDGGYLEGALAAGVAAVERVLARAAAAPGLASR